jgi:hypothetical protein
LYPYKAGRFIPEVILSDDININWKKWLTLHMPFLLLGHPGRLIGVLSHTVPRKTRNFISILIAF